MVTYQLCSEAEMEKVYEGFKIGFSDYIIKLEISQEDFVKRFFGPEGNRPEYSFIALDDEKPVGVILGGIKDFDGVKTIRCGALCVQPEYRGQGVSKELFRLHKQTALDKGCKQMFLEVIAGNDRAIKFYSNLGYGKIYDLSYYSHKNASGLQSSKNNAFDVQQIDYNAITSLSGKINDVHLNWQNDFDYIEKLEGLAYYGIFDKSELIGALSISKNGKIFFVWVTPEHRHRGIAKALIIEAVKDLKLEKLSISFPNNSRLEGFAKHMGFEKDKLSQYEMYLTL